MKTISELLEEATARAVPVVRGIDDAQLSGGTPCSEYDVRALLNHLFSVIGNFRVLAAKGTSDFSRTEDVVTGDWRGRFDDETARLVRAWGEPGAEEGTTGGMAMPARTVGLMVLGDLTVHAWDLARATDGDTELDGELVTAALVFAEQLPEDGVPGLFDPPLDVSAAADPQTRLLARFGRKAT